MGKLGKLLSAIFAILCAIGLFKLLEYGFDGEMLYECHQFQQWQDQGHPNEIPEYCYELGLPRR